MSAVDKFPILLSEAEEESSAVPPCFSDEGINVRALHTVTVWSSLPCKLYRRSLDQQAEIHSSISIFDTTTSTS